MKILLCTDEIESILHHDNVPVIVSRSTSLIEDFVIRRYQDTKTFLHEVDNDTLFFFYFPGPIFGFVLVFTMLGCLLHGMAGAEGLSSFLLASLRISEYSLSSGSVV